MQSPEAAAHFIEIDRCLFPVHRDLRQRRVSRPELPKRVEERLCAGAVPSGTNLMYGVPACRTYPAAATEDLEDPSELVERAQSDAHIERCSAPEGARPSHIGNRVDKD